MTVTAIFSGEKKTVIFLTQCCLAVININMGWLIRVMFISYIKLFN